MSDVSQYRVGKDFNNICLWCGGNHPQCDPTECIAILRKRIESQDAKIDFLGESLDKAIKLINSLPIEIRNAIK